MAKPLRNAMSRFAGGLRTVLGIIERRFLSTSGAIDQQRPIRDRDFSSYRVRRARYALQWAYYENTAYSAIHAWSARHKADNGLYPLVNNILTIVYRLVEFSATHIYGGSIDPDCGDGKSVPSAIPIVTENPALRPAISRVFAANNFDAEKTVLCRIGAALGDVGLFAVDDVGSGKTYLQVIDPVSIVEYREAPDGTTMAYAIEEWRPDPRHGVVPDQYGELPRVLYREEAELESGDDGPPDRCRFRTFLDSSPFDWPSEGVPSGRVATGVPSDPPSPVGTWTEPYPFVPLTLIAHTKILPGSPFGQGEALPVLSKIRELDEVASRFHVHIAKAVDAMWLLKGFSTSPKMAEGIDPDALKAIIGGPEAGAQALLANLDMSHVDGHLKLQQDDLKDDFPELRRDIESAAGDASGKALRMSLARCEAKYQTRRAGYDAGLTKAITQCVRIGGIRGYEGFDEFAPDKVAANPRILAFRIADRPVFKPDPQTQLDLETAFLANCESADRAGIPVTAYLEITGRKDWLEVVLRERQKMLDAGLPVGRAKQAPPPNDSAATAIQAPGGSAP